MTALRERFRDPRWRYARTAAFIALIAFIAFSVLSRLSSNYEDLEGQSFIGGWRGVVATVTFTIAVLVSGVLWRSTVDACARTAVPLGSAVRANTAAWLLKYVPGQVGAFAWKASWGPKVGISKSQATVAFIYENLFLGITSTVPTIPILLVGLGSTATTSLGWYLVAGVAVAVAFVGLSMEPVLRRIITLLIRVTKRKVDPAQLSFIGLGDALRLQLLYTVPRIINGIGFVVLVSAVYDVGPGDVVILTAAYTLAGILGILAVFVPSGIGVREAVIVIVLSRMMPVELAAVCAINARIYATIADGVLGVGYLLGRERKQAVT
ncbi:MAG: flippase-like domain-containing protein [Actinobacteria bacterium]|nr:flippase-like domain-containing protein [Actinomycetota bacterium]